tara:strand:+ start:828 stop:1115 length:288 start_codon:yes stop_codon:yes gene_type:complete
MKRVGQNFNFEVANDRMYCIEPFMDGFVLWPVGDPKPTKTYIKNNYGPFAQVYFDTIWHSTLLSAINHIGRQEEMGRSVRQAIRELRPNLDVDVV